MIRSTVHMQFIIQSNVCIDKIVIRVQLILFSSSFIWFLFTLFNKITDRMSLTKQIHITHNQYIYLYKLT